MIRNRYSIASRFVMFLVFLIGVSLAWISGMHSYRMLATRWPHTLKAPVANATITDPGNCIETTTPRGFVFGHYQKITARISETETLTEIIQKGCSLRAPGETISVVNVGATLTQRIPIWSLQNDPWTLEDFILGPAMLALAIGAIVTGLRRTWSGVKIAER